MKKQVKATPVTIDDLLNNNLNSARFEYITPTSATVLTNNAGTLVREVDGGKLYLVMVGDWFRYTGNQNLPQITEFDQLSGYNLTQLKKQVVTFTPSKDEETGIQPESKEVEILVVKEKAVKRKKKDDSEV